MLLPRPVADLIAKIVGRCYCPFWVLRPEEAMTEILQKLVFNKIIVLFLRKIGYVHEIKQNEKHPCI